MKLLNLKIKDILSLENAELSFKDSGLVLVEGWNYDASRGNGSGKTAIFNALSFALYDKIPRNVTKREILRHGAKDGFAWCEISVNGDVYSVRRDRPTGCTYAKNGEPLPISQVEFEEKIGLSYDQFMVTMYSAQDTKNRFISLNDKGKKDFILEVLGLKNFDKYCKDAKDSIKAVESSKTLKETELKGLLSNKEIYRSNVIDDTQYKSKINSNTNEITIFGKEYQTFKKVNKPDISKYKDLEDKILSKILEMQQIKNQIDTIKDRYHSKSLEITPFIVSTHDDNCPDCNSALNIIGKKVVKATDQASIKEAHEQKNLLLSIELKDLHLQIRKLSTKLSAGAKIEEIKSKLQQQKMNDQKDYVNATNEMNRINTLISQKEQENRGLRDSITRSDANKIKLKGVEDKISSLENEVKKHISDIDVLKSVSNIFSPIGAPAYVMDSVVESFNESADKYVSMIWPTAVYKLQTHKVNKDKKITAKFSESLTMGAKECSIGSLSGGELKSLSLALDFAIIDVLGKQHGMNINPIILDEPFDGLDSTGKEIVIELLDKLSRERQIWVIDHASEAKTLFSDIVRVEKRSGISKIVI